MNKINLQKKRIKKAIKKRKNPESWGLSIYSFSPYEACQHACKYCDGRSEKYYVQGNFEKDITIRENLVDCLKNELPKLRQKGLISIGSGITDPYQPIEKKMKLMRKSAKVLSKHNFAVSVLTKSALVRRDLDYWKKLKKGFVLYMTISFLDEDLRKLIEPNASPIEERLKTLKEFKENGLYVGVLMMPIIPFIADSFKKLSDTVQKFSEINVDFVVPGSLTLRPGKQKKLFVDIIKKNYPEFLSNYSRIYNQNRQSGMPRKPYDNRIYGRISKILKRYKIPSLPPHYIYRNFLSNYDEILILLNQMAFHFRNNGIDITRLKRSRKRYQIWLDNEKKNFRRRRKLANNHLEELFLNSFDFGEIEKIIDNEKLYKFIKKVVFEKKVFNSIDLKLN